MDEAIKKIEASNALKVGLIINPMAGVGGSVALKGSDAVYAEAIARGATPKSQERVATFLLSLTAQLESLSKSARQRIEFFAMPLEMGETVLADAGYAATVLGEIESHRTSGEDTRRGAQLMAAAGVDLLLFAGGDGTARDIVDANIDIACLLGIPCGVKMHSGVFATSPSAAAGLVAKLIEGTPIAKQQAEVRDVDETRLREGLLNTRFYGELPVPEDIRFVQQTKVGGFENSELVQQEIAGFLLETMHADTLYLVGAGSTLAGVMAGMGLEATLLGIDVIRNGEVIARDATEKALLSLLQPGVQAQILVTAIGGQGYIFGRGNQQLSAQVIKRVGLTNIQIVATKTKLTGLGGRPLLVDTGDAVLDRELCGLVSVLAGFDDHVLYRISDSMD